MSKKYDLDFTQKHSIVSESVRSDTTLSVIQFLPHSTTEESNKQAMLKV